jgi:SnoaL-like domain
MLSDEQLQELYDKQKLHDNLMQYCRGLDRFDVELMKSTYWRDSTDDHGSFVGSGHDWCEAAVAWKSVNYSVNHHISNVYSEIEGNRAKRESMFLVVVNFKDPAISMFQGGRYRDLCEKRNGEWKILRRVCIWDWCEQCPTQPGWDLVNTPKVTHWGAYHPDDPIYKDWWSSPPTPYPR